MKTSERREKADRALNQIDKLEMEIQAQMKLNNIQGELDANYADFKSYTKLRELHEHYTDWKKQYALNADNADLVDLVGQSEHDILRENYPRLTSDSMIVSIETNNKVYFYERDKGTGHKDKVSYELNFEKIRILPFYTCYLGTLNSLFIRVNLAGVPH